MRYREVVKIVLGNFNKKEDLAKMPQPETWYKMSTESRLAIVHKELNNMAQEMAERHEKWKAVLKGVLQ